VVQARERKWERRFTQKRKQEIRKNTWEYRIPKTSPTERSLVFIIVNGNLKAVFLS
jgi:hypothetical protein